MKIENICVTEEQLLKMVVEKLADDCCIGDVDASDMLRQQIEKRVSKLAQDAISDKLNTYIEETLSNTIKPVDCWGEPTGVALSLKDMIKNRADTYLSEKVNSDLRPDTYNGKPRLEHLVYKAVQAQVDSVVKRELDKAIEEAKLQLRNTVAKHIADTLLKK
jgi:hypothetical protein